MSENTGSSEKRRPSRKRVRAKKAIYMSFLILSLLVSAICIFVAVNFIGKYREAAIELQLANVHEANLESQLADAYSKSEVDAIITAASENAAIQKEADIKNTIRENMSSKDANTAELLRTLFPEYVVYRSSEGYAFDEINKSIPANPYSNSDINMNEDGQMTYTPGGEPHYQKGIDVSQHQGTIDWEKVKESGIDYAFIRVGIRGYGSGKLVIDDQFENNIVGALSNGIGVGVYFFSQAITEDEAIEEADFVLQAIAPYKITYPVAIDIEKTEDSSGRGNSISKTDRTHYTDVFCQCIKDAGYTPMIYGNTFSLFSMLDMASLYQYKTWVAFYSNSYLYYPYMLDTWQYTDSLTIPGIKGNVDGNITFIQ